jgi:hypothetical protein
MPQLNEIQEHLLPYIDEYQKLIREIGDCIMNYHQGYIHNPRIITSKENEWLIFQFYPALHSNLEKVFPFNSAENIEQKIDEAHKVLANLMTESGYEKYTKAAVASDDTRKLKSAYDAAGEILESNKQPAARTDTHDLPDKKSAGSWYWKLYETTLKVFVDAVLERFWPKPK